MRIEVEGSQRSAAATSDRITSRAGSRERCARVAALDVRRLWRLFSSADSFTYATDGIFINGYLRQLDRREPIPRPCAFSQIRITLSGRGAEEG